MPTEFETLITSGIAEALDEMPQAFSFRGNQFTGIFSPGEDLAALSDGGFELNTSGLLIIPFTQAIGTEPKHDEIITIENKRYAIANITKNEASWDVNLRSEV